MTASSARGLLIVLTGGLFLGPECWELQELVMVTEVRCRIRTSNMLGLSRETEILTSHIMYESCSVYYN